MPDIFCNSRRELRELKVNNSRWDLLIQIRNPNSSAFTWHRKIRHVKKYLSNQRITNTWYRIFHYEKQKFENVIYF